MSNLSSQATTAKWARVLDAKGQPQLTPGQRALAAHLLERTVFTESGTIAINKFLTESPITQSGPAGATAGLSVNLDGTSGNPGDGTSIAGYDSIAVSMIPRAIPSLIALDVMGVQPLRGPSGLAFATRWEDEAGREWLNPADPNALTSDPASGVVTSSPMNTVDQGEKADSAPAIKELILRISRVSAQTKTRNFRARLTDEVLSDVRNLFGIGPSVVSDAMAGVACHTINKEALDLIRVSAINAGTLTVGTFTDDEYHRFFFRLQQAATRIAQDTGRSRGNFIVVSRDVAAYIWSWMTRSTVFDMPFSSVDASGNALAHAYLGKISGDTKVYIDYSAPSGYMVVGARGSDPYDAGIFFCPYNLCEEFVEMRESASMQPIIGTRARYAFLANPSAIGFNNSSGVTADILGNGKNRFYRRFTVSGLPADTVI